MENGPFIDGSPIKNGSFSIAMPNDRMVKNPHFPPGGN
jgi:hypothetical protein